MLQIIGWLGCAMLAVKLLEIAANPAMRQDDGDLRIFAAYALVVGWASVFGFAVWLMVQGGAAGDLPIRGSDLPPLSDAQINCISNARNNDEVLACAK